MNLTPTDLDTMRQALVDLRSQIEETGPCDHPVNICVCGLRNTYESLGSLFYRITDKRVGFAPTPELIDLEQMTRNILGIKPDADVANAAFRKGTIND